MYNFGGKKNKNTSFINSTGYNNDSQMCKDHPNLCNISEELSSDSYSTKSKIYLLNSKLKALKEMRKKDTCSLEQMEKYYKDLQKEQVKLYNKRKKELEEEVSKKQKKLEKELSKFGSKKPSMEPLKPVKCNKVSI